MAKDTELYNQVCKPEFDDIKASLNIIEKLRTL